MLFMVRGNDGSATFLVLIHDNNYSQVYFAWKEIDNNLQIHDKLQQYNKFCNHSRFSEMDGRDENVDPDK